ncbi:MAG: hypothetical protein WD768_07990 [Phycisphaeraceae bacterium]
MPDTTDKKTRILYCRCAYAKVVPLETKDEVLRRLCDSGEAFDAVPDLCEMSARRDPALKSLAQSSKDGECVKIAACYPRAVKWLFAAADAKLPEENVEILNMRTETPEAVTSRLLEREPVEQKAGK